MSCSVCTEKAQFTDSINLYCSQLCQITGNLTVLMNDSKWNKDVFMMLMKQLNIVERYKLLDTLLKEAATQRQRDKLLEWMKDQSLELYDVARFGVQLGLTSLILYYKNYDNEDLFYLDWYIQKGDIYNFPITFDMFRVISSKLPTKQNMDTMPYLLSRYAYISLLITEFIIDKFKVSDWIHEFILRVRDSIDILSQSVSTDTVARAIREYEANLRNILIREPNSIFKNIAKRNKNGD